MGSRRYIRRRDRSKVNSKKVSGDGVILLRYTGPRVSGVPLFHANGTPIKRRKK